MSWAASGVVWASVWEEFELMVGKTIVALAAAGAVALAASGCGSDDDGGSTGTASTAATAPATTATAGEPVNAAFITLSYLPFNQQEVLGAKRVLERNGGSVKVFNANFDPAAQLQQCLDAITTGRYQALIISAVDAKSIGPCIAQAKDAEIPVVTIENAVGDDRNDNAPQIDGVVASVVTNPATKAETVTEQVRAACEGIDPCKVIFEIATPNDPLTTGSLEAVKQNAGENVEVVQTFAGHYDQAVLVKTLPDILSAHPDANVYASDADSQAVAALPLIEQAGLTDKIKVLGNGGSKQGIEALKAGKIVSSIGTWPIQMGEAAARSAEQAANGETITDPAIDGYKIDGPALITKANVDRFKPEW